MKEKCHFCEYDYGPLVGTSEVCRACHDCDKFQLKKRMTPMAAYKYEKLKKEEEWINDQSIVFDRDTALIVLNALSERMYPSTDIFGNKTLVIDRYRFEAVRKKFLDRKR